MQAILEAPDPSTHSRERDRVLLMLLYNTGARVSEVVSLRMEDILLVPQASVHNRGKGRKHRAVPLWRQTVNLLRPWLRRLGGSPPSLRRRTSKPGNCSTCPRGSRTGSGELVPNVAVNPALRSTA
jgi:site-specific recombinase XerD